MAREVIGSIWDRTNRNNINNNFEELFNDLGTAAGTKDKFDNFLNGTGVISSKMLEYGAVHGNYIRDGGIGTRHLLDDTVSRAKIKDGAVTTAKIQNGAVTTAKIPDNNIIDRHIANKSISGFKIADGAISTDKISDYSVTESKLGVASVTSGKLGANAVTQAKIAPEAVTESKLGTRSVSSRALALQSVTGSHLEDISVTTPKIGAHAVTGPKIAPESISESKFSTNSVSNRALALGAVNPNNVKFVREPVRNLFNRLNVIDNKVVNFSTGQLTDHDNFVTTEDIEVVGGVTYSLSQIYYLVFKDAEGNIIGDVITSPQHSLNQVTSPTDAKTVQFSIHKIGFPDLNDFIFVRGNQYNLESYALEISHLKLKHDAVSWENSDYLTRTNDHAVVDLYTDYKISAKGYMALTTNGEFVSTTSTTNYRHTDFISVIPGTFLLRKYQRHMVFYDKNKIFITGNAAPNAATREGKNGYGTSVPANAKYVVLNVREPDTDEYLLQVRNDSSALKIPELIVEKHQIKNFDEHIASGNPLDGKTGVAFGDSITQHGEYTKYISDMANCDYINVGFGATRLTRSDRLNYPWAKIGMCELTDSIVTNDWSVTDDAISAIDDHYGNTTYSTIYNRLKSIDFNNVDFITFMYGTNDSAAAVFELGEKDSVDTYTVNGALNHILQTLITTYPHIKVYALSPIFRQKNSNWGTGDSDDSKMPDGVYLYDIAQAIVDKAKEYHVPVKDMYNESGINRYNANHFLKDGVHPGDAGNQLMNEVIYKYLQSY